MGQNKRMQEFTDKILRGKPTTPPAGGNEKIYKAKDATINQPGTLPEMDVHFDSATNQTKKTANLPAPTAKKKKGRLKQGQLFVEKKLQKKGKRLMEKKVNKVEKKPSYRLAQRISGTDTTSYELVPGKTTMEQWGTHADGTPNMVPSTTYSKHKISNEEYRKRNKKK